MCEVASARGVLIALEVRELFPNDLDIWIMAAWQENYAEVMRKRNMLCTAKHKE